MSANTLLTSTVTGGVNSHATTAEEANALATDFVTAGVVGTIGINVGSGGTGSFCVNADTSPDMGVTIKAGQAYITASPSGQNSQVLRVRAAADYTTYVINANASGSTKYDWVYLSVSAANANAPSADGSNVASFVTSRSSSNTSDNGTPPTYGIVLAVITVANGASSITNSNIQDKRTGASISTASSAIGTGWNSLSYTPNTVTALGNRSYSLVFNSTDITGTASPGMRLKTTRTTAAPTQCTSLNGTTQFYSKTSPAGMTFTNNFVTYNKFKITSYGTTMMLQSRYNGTSGWSVYIDVNGCVNIQGNNAGSANWTKVLTYQSVPLNKWVTVVCKLDMSSAVLTGGTNNYIMIDEVEVPIQRLQSGTNPTALVQAGNYEIGSWNGGLLPFGGKLSQTAVFSAHVTEATMISYSSQTLAGTETSLISAYSFNNSINDLNANANNLTANGSAVATNADSPFGGQADGTISSTLDYAIVTKTAFSTNTTLTVQVPEGCTIPTSGGVSAVSYATVKAPYGMPVQRGKWEVLTVIGAGSGNVTISAANQYFSLLNQLTVPVGEWVLGYELALQAAGTTIVYWGSLLAPATPTNAVRTSELYWFHFDNATASQHNEIASRKSSVSLSSATAYLVYGEVITSTGTATMALTGNLGLSVIKAENALL